MDLALANLVGVSLRHSPIPSLVIVRHHVAHSESHHWANSGISPNQHMSTVSQDPLQPSLAEPAYMGKSANQPPTFAGGSLLSASETPEKQNEQVNNLLKVPMNVKSTIKGEADSLGNGGRMTPTSVNVLDVFQNLDPSYNL